ncbi:hypothetical protein M3Y97_00751500 [Aphelenchoides bicaudatus]|nr:hypothetical protein M3Y97_00751500 [Aphelenchoides bicaudatus]
MRTALYAFLLYFIPLSLQNEDCLLARDKGDKTCDESGGLRFYYDTRTRHCQPFLYEASDCRSKCSNVSMDDADAANGHGMVLVVPKCPGNVRAAIDDKSVPLKCSECPENHECIKDVCCPNKEAVCEVEYDTGRYAFQGSHTPRYFYSKQVNNCLLFTYYGALGNGNNFEKYQDCMNFCHAD